MRRWAGELMHWCNDQHRHSTIGFETPNQRYSGEDQALLEQRRQIYEFARNAHSHRWFDEPRDWAFPRRPLLMFLRP